jgi:hypothetical protein
MKGIKDMSEKNICQNPKCCDRDSNDRWNKKIDKFQSRKAYFKPTSREYRNIILEYFCTTSCSGRWLEDNLESIVDHRGTWEKILEKKIRQ